MRDTSSKGVAAESLSETVSHLLEECRMVLPGIQAIFGFQLVAVFNQVFWEQLAAGERQLHLLAVALIAVAIALVMTPAAYHRQTRSDSVSWSFVVISSRCLLWSMFPLMAGICIDFYLIARLILQDVALSMIGVSIIAACFVVPWFVLPRVKALQRWVKR